MPFLAHFLFTIAYSTAAAAAGIALMRYTQLDLEMVIIASAGLWLTVMMFHGALSGALRHQSSERDMLTLRNDVRKVAGRIGVVESRLTQLDDIVTRELEERREAIVSEMRELEELIAKLGQSFDARLSDAKATDQPKMASRLRGETALAAVQDALRENRVDLHLQPIVNLPQRRVCFYEGFTRLRDAKGQLIMPKDFLDAAKTVGLLGVIDNMLLFRCVQIVRRLSERDRRVGVFCNISTSSLEDEGFFPQFLDFMRDNQDLAGSLIFEIGLQNFKDRSPVMARNMGRLVDIGFRFSVDKSDTLSVDLPELQAEGVRFIKVEGRVLLDQLVSGGPRPKSAVTKEVAPEDVSAVFSRYGVELIAEKVETEKDVVEILDFDIPYGQGHVFGAPRPIKGALLEETTPPEDFLRRAAGSA